MNKEVAIFINFVSVKKVIAILFLAGYMFSTTEMYQLLKLPVLVEHFFEHKVKNPDVSVWSFLTLHYGGYHLENHPHDDDYEQDRKLPFMSYTNVSSFCFVNTPPFRFEINNRPYPTRKDKLLVFNEKNTDNDFISSIWQPPKFC